MFSQNKGNEDINHLPQIRTNKHFRIKSATKDKFLQAGQILSTRSKRKGSSIDDPKVILSQNKYKKSALIESILRGRGVKQQCAKKQQTQQNKIRIVYYESVKTEEEQMNQSIKYVNHKTINHEQNVKQLQKIVKICDPIRIFSKEKLQNRSKLISQSSNKFKKDKSQKQPKGKYKCRVNQYIFDHSRKKSNVQKDQQETIDEFWKNVNESLILGGGKQDEQVSKDLRQFVQNFTTQ